MAYPKPHLFDIEEQVTSKYCRVLGYPARLRILKLLHASGGMYVNELNRRIPLSQSVVSDHLRMLRELDFIHVEVRGRFNFYRVNYSELALAWCEIDLLFESWCGDLPVDRES